MKHRISLLYHTCKANSPCVYDNWRMRFCWTERFLRPNRLYWLRHPNYVHRVSRYMGILRHKHPYAKQLSWWNRKCNGSDKRSYSFRLTIDTSSVAISITFVIVRTIILVNQLATKISIRRVYITITCILVILYRNSYGLRLVCLVKCGNLNEVCVRITK
ncbi:hypothetical protein IEU_03552 [Bacillus mycoides]|nr:hypothetical protein IEW_03552 [Bacillus mycoides]EJQ66598.1 hypothetical protein IEY_01782 [Bacillus mycoides]EJV65338.1 hypothetical protein IEU_03552 [Bacillus mycoides]